MDRLRNTTYLTTPFLKKLFNKDNKTLIHFSKKLSRGITEKTGNKDIASMIKKQFNNIASPYEYDEIQHIKNILKYIYHLVIKLISNNAMNNDEFRVIKDNTKFSLDNDDFKKLYNSLHHCLKVINKGVYTITKKGLGKTKNYFVYKIKTSNDTLYLIIHIYFDDHQYVDEETGEQPGYYIFDMYKYYESKGANDEYIKNLLKKSNVFYMRNSKSRSSSHRLKTSSYSSL